MRKLKQKKWLCIGASSAFLLLYFGLYLFLRVNHTFIHRAKLSAGDYRRGISVELKHSIEPGHVEELPRRTIAKVVRSTSETPEPENFSDVDLGQMLIAAFEEAEKIMHRRERLLLIFTPATFLEASIWKVLQPLP